ncbi:transmembrane protein 17A [Xenopus laevis]|uniref:Transmembrane protein 17A n=2 Tax=Xenopus laevis TaxID=8355 RepID=A0A1L8GFM4_XENLA|nr:transmembrane protein 17A [Xenopus laevis]OCT82663.1 hypothetical protein XELAEV_18025193mg [Xenopus laevis]
MFLFALPAITRKPELLTVVPETNGSALIILTGCRMAQAGAVRRQLDSLTHNIFMRDVGRTVAEKSGALLAGESEVAPSVSLQIFLYFNAFYFPLWWVCYVLMLELKYALLPDYYKFILVILLILMSVIEAIRLYLGYSGNLQQKVPELAGFCLLSILLQLPLLLFLLCDPGLEPLPLERATHAILTAFLLIQIPISIFTLRKATRHLAGRFHQLGDLDGRA